MTLRYFIILIFIGLLVGCVDEPTIEPAPIPYSTVRVGNFADNVDAIQVTIDGEKSYTINKGELTPYFDLTSGKRDFVVTNTASSETIFTSSIEVTAYEELTIVLSGYSAPGDEFNNSFTNFNFTEGFVYLFEGPEDPNNVWVRFFNVISDTPDEAAPEIAIESYDVTGDSSVTTSTFAFNEYVGLSVPQGAKSFVVLNDAAEPDTLAVFEGNNVEAGNDYFFFVARQDTTLTLYSNSRVPLEVRSK